MQVVKFLVGIVLVQVITMVLMYLSPVDMAEGSSILRLVVPLFFVALMVAFWFSSLSLHERKDLEYKIKDEFAKEREKLKVNAERAKTRVIKEAEKKIAKEATVAHAKANFKVGAAFAGVMGVGALFVFAQLVTVGLLTMTATAGAIGGYYWRGRGIERANNRLKELEVIDTKVIKG
jgi:uncharacterized membrane protein